MERHRPTECKWCGAVKTGEDGDDILFKCGSWHSGSTPEFQWSQCELNVANDRIRRAIETLKATERRYVSNGFAMYVDARDVEHAVKILEGGDAKTD